MTIDNARSSRFGVLRALAIASMVAVAGSLIAAVPAPAFAAGCTIVGTDRADVLEGTSGNDVICGGGGNDVLRGLDGADTLDGGTGSDSVEGGAGADTLDGGNENDLLSGGEGNDTIMGGAGNDRISGGDGGDRIDGGNDHDRLVGDAGNDTISGATGNDFLDGGEGDDTLDGGNDADTIAGGVGDDRLTGSFGTDTVLGGSGADTIDGGQDADTLIGGSGPDVLIGGFGTDTLNGGPGDDRLDGGADRDSCDGFTGDNAFVSCESTSQRPGPDLATAISDLDGDRMPDDAELRFGSDPAKADTDGDGLLDDAEFLANTDPRVRDTDGDGTFDPNDDADQDRRTNKAEVEAGTNPIVSDTDGDTLDDGREAELSTDPLRADTDGDALADGDELVIGTDPLTADTDADGTGDAIDQAGRAIDLPELGASFVAEGPGLSVANVELRTPGDEQLQSVVGLRAPPVEIIADESVTGTLTVSFDTEGMTADTNLAILHYDEDAGLFDTPANQTVDIQTGIATVTTSDFSPFVLVDIDEFEAIWADEITVPREGSGQGQPIDVVLALDSSGSMEWNDPNGERKVAASLFVNALLDGDRAGIVDFDSVGFVRQALTDDRSAAMAAIADVDSVGGTNISEAMRASLDELDRNADPASARIIVLLTDGVGDYDFDYTTRAVDSSTTVYTVGLGAGTDQGLLDGIATATGGKFYLVENASDLGGTFGDIGGDIGAPDSDGDGLADTAETGGLRTAFGKIVTDPNKADTDDDGLTDSEEIGPLGSGAKYGAGTYFKLRSDPTKADSDADGLTDIQELDIETAPRLKDSDGDGLGDLQEIADGFDPLSFNPDTDFRFDDQERREGTDPFVYDFDLNGNIHSAFSGLIFGDAWDTDWARALNVDTNVASNGWYLVGQIASGLLVIGDLRDMVNGVATGRWADAATAAVGFIPLAGDAVRVSKVSVQFAAKSTNAVYGALPIINKLPPAQARIAQKLLAQLPGARLAQDVSAESRTAKRPNFDIAAGDWAGGVPRRISGDSDQARALDEDLAELVRLKRSGVNIDDVRVNQTQVDASGRVIGVNRPDLQYTKDGKRYYVEYDRPKCSDRTTTRRGEAHSQRLLNNDPAVEVGVQIVITIIGRCE